MDEFKKMIGLQIVCLASWLLIGGGIAVFSHHYILGVLPASEWSPIIGWILAGVVGYVVGGMMIGMVVLAVFIWVMSGDSSRVSGL